MAVINYYDNILDTVSFNEEVNEGCLLDLVKNRIDNIEDDSMLVEVYHADTDTTEYVKEVPETYKIIALVNGEESTLNYEITGNEVISIIFIPENKGFAAAFNFAIGVTLVALGVGLMLAGNPGGWVALAAGAVFLWGGLTLMKEDPVSYEQKEDEKLPYLSGAENELQLNNRYLFTMGRHLLSPRIAGSPYHNTKVTNFAKAEDGGQELHVLYCAGYGPLKVTDIKMGEEILAYNKSSASGDRKTVYHGQLSGCDDPEKGIIGDLPVKWKNNDIKLEILQAGSLVEKLPDVPKDSLIQNKYGTVYPQVVLEKEINANCLYVYDKTIEEIAQEKYSVVYYNKSIPIGYRNNGVRYSSSCPSRLEVELDFPNGLFATRQEKKDNQFINKYFNIPLNIAVQWRFTGRNVDASDAESPKGWHNFNFIHFQEEDIAPSVYTDSDRKNEINCNKGLSEGTKAEQNGNWVGSEVFKLTDGKFTPHNQDNFNYTERRYVFTYDFTEEECRKLAGFDTSDNILDIVEVRVIRISPCYLNQANSDDSENHTAFNYQDIFKWSYLRTFSFDKTKYLEALKEAEDPDTVSVKDFPERPMPIDSDLDKFCYIALQATEDSAGTIGGNIKRISCITESFNPKYDMVEKKWYPEDIWEEYKYYQKYKDGNDYKKRQITKAEYEAGVVEDQENFIKQKKGNDFTEQVREEIFTSDNIVTDEDGEKILSPMVKYSVPESISKRYISSNTAAQFVHAVTGPHLGIDARTYDYLQMDSMTDLYEFCEDVTDGTPENYTGINSKLISQIEPCNPDRIHPSIDFQDAGYTEYPDDSYGTVWSRGWTRADGSETVVVTMVRNSKSEGVKGIISKEMFEGDNPNSLMNKYINNDSSFDDSIVMARFTGGNQVVAANRYAQIFHMLNAAYFEPNQYSPDTDEYLEKAKECFEILKDVHINALRSGIKSDVIKELNIALCERESLLTGEKFDADPIYESYIIDILEQTAQSSNPNYRMCKGSDDLQHIKFECNGVIDKEVKLETLLQKILLTGRSSLKRSDENKYEPMIGRPNPYPVTILNQRNCVSKSNARTLEDLPSGFSVTCIDEDDNYTQNNFYVMAKGEDYRDPLSRIEPFTLEYVTNKWQLASLARFNLACKLYQIESYTRTVGILGYAVTLGDTVLLQDDSLLIGTDKGGRIMELLQDNNKVYGFITDEPFNYTGQVNEEGLSVQGCTILQPQQRGKSRSITMRCASPDKEPIIIDGKQYAMNIGLTNLFIFETPIAKNDEESDDADVYIYKPKIDNIVAFGLVDSIFSKAVITGIKHSDKGQFTLSLVPYNEDLYNCGFGQPVFKSNMTTSTLIDDFEFNDNVTKRTIADEVENFAGSAISEIRGELKVSEAPDAFTPTAIAREDGLKLSVNFNDSTTLNNSVQSVLWEILYEDPDNPGEYLTIDTYDTTVAESIYTFDRGFIGYPEKDTPVKVIVKNEHGESIEKIIPAIQDWRVRAKVTNVYGVQSEEWCSLIVVNTDGYGTWKFDNNKPSLSHRVSDRTISIICSMEHTSTVQYGNTRFKVRIRRCKPDGDITPETEEKFPFDPVGVFFEPDLKSNVYPEKEKKDGEEILVRDNINAYKTSGDGSAIVSAIHIQTVPLWGQGHNDIHNTPYEFEVIAFNESGNESAPAYETATALCTSIRDIVEANLDVKSQYVENLTAISSAFGFVSGGINSDEQLKNIFNYWALNDNVISYDGGADHINRIGAFRVGGQEQYLKVIPILDKENPSLPPTDYKLELNVGDFVLSSTETRFNNEMLVYSKENPELRLKITHQGIYFERQNQDGSWNDNSIMAKVEADTDGNMTITNAEQNDPTLPKNKTLVPSGSKIYHLENNTLDENNENSGNFNFVPYDSENKFIDSSLINSQYKAFSGIISKESEEEVLCFFNKGNKMRFGQKVIDLDKLKVDDTCDLLNNILGTSAFRWED